MFHRKHYFWWVGVLLVTLLTAAGCGGGGGEPTAVADAQPPTVTINAPADQAILPAGQAVQISVVANDDQTISRIELYVDNSLIESRIVPAGSALTTVSEQFTWSASMVGPHSLQARAYDAAGQMGASRIVGVQVQIAGAPTSTPAGSTDPGSEATATVAVPTVPPASPTTESPQVQATVNANVRGGPGTNYYVVGSLGVGEAAPVTGRNADSSWWQINYQGSAAWIADSVVTANAAAQGAPVVNAPPPPPTNTPAPPTATSPPTATPGPSVTPAPTTGFRVDQSNLSAGQCTTLRWDFDNISAIYVVLGSGYDEAGRPGHGTAEVCPSVTTTYKARVVRPDTTQEVKEVTVNVSGGGCGDPVIQRFVPTTDYVAAGKPFSVFWEVTCAKSVRYIKGGGFEQTVSNQGSSIDETISSDTTFKLKVQKNNGEFVYASFVVRIQ
jgi:uncharacterized protein YraI